MMSIIRVYGSTDFGAPFRRLYTRWQLQTHRRQHCEYGDGDRGAQHDGSNSRRPDATPRLVAGPFRRTSTCYFLSYPLYLESLMSCSPDLLGVLDFLEPSDINSFSIASSSNSSSDMNSLPSPCLSTWCVPNLCWSETSRLFADKIWHPPRCDALASSEFGH